MTQAQLDDKTYLKQVRDQYEELPYPPRDPAKELEALLFPMTCGLDRLNYYHYEGKRDFRENFNVLVAGCGTGDAVVALAAQLYGTKAQITALDMSTASLNVAKARAEARGLDNIRFVHDSLLNVAAHAKQPFDLINCIGVLHHLEVPEAGLKALETVLAPGGVMHLMLYARYGRQSVYQMQSLMRIINQHEPQTQRKVEYCRRVLNQLPPHHEFRRFVNTIMDVNHWGDAGLYDLLLHSHDVAYTVPQVYDFLASAGLQPSHWFFGVKPQGNMLYLPEGHIRDAELLQKVKQLPLREQQAVAELMDSSIALHEFYAVREVPALPRKDDRDMVPHLDVMQTPGLALELGTALQALGATQQLQVQFFDQTVLIANTPHAGLLLQYMDGNASLGEILAKVRAAVPSGNPTPDDATLLAEFYSLFATFNQFDLMFLRHRTVPANRGLQEAGVAGNRKV